MSVPDSTEYWWGTGPQQRSRAHRTRRHQDRLYRMACEAGINIAGHGLDAFEVTDAASAEYWLSLVRCEAGSRRIEVTEHRPRHSSVIRVCPVRRGNRDGA